MNLKKKNQNKIKKGKKFLIISMIALMILPMAGCASDEDVAAYEAKKQQEELEKQKGREKTGLLNVKARLERARKNGEDISAGISLTEEEIKNYGITEEEITKFNEEVIALGGKIDDKYTVREFERIAKKEIKPEIEKKTVYAFPTIRSNTEHKFNEDKSKCTIIGTYESKNEYGIDVRGEYQVEFDVATKEIVNKVVGEEKVTGSSTNKNNTNNKNTKNKK